VTAFAEVGGVFPLGGLGVVAGTVDRVVPTDDVVSAVLIVVEVVVAALVVDVRDGVVVVLSDRRLPL
jgi:hypothetical protein